MNDLNAVSDFSVHDPADYLKVVEDFPDQLLRAEQAARDVDGLPSADGIDSICVLGMGGSGVSGNVLQAVLGNSSKLFVSTVKGYDIPGWVGPNTLVFAASYSGNTEETLSAVDQAIAKGARLVAVSTGGKLTQLAASSNLPVVKIPAGLQPRAALGYLAIPLLLVTEAMGLCPPVTADLQETIELMQRRAAEYGRSVPASDNPAKRLAQELFGRIPIIYGAEGLSEVAAYRWKCQFNECSKIPAYWHSFSELNHNEIVGWNKLKDATRENLGLIVLRHAGDHPRNAKRIDITLPLIQDNLGLVQEVVGSGESRLATLFDLIYLGDFAATYLAVAEGVDPAPVVVIESLKAQLAG